MTITIPALTSLAAQPGGNVAASLFDTNWSLIRNALTGQVMSEAEITAAIAAAIAAGALPRSYLAGYATNNNVADATNDLDIGVGSCRDSTNAANLTLATALTKQLDVAWAVGTNQGGLDIGTIANGTYHVHAIMRSDTGVVDAILSRNYGVTSVVTMTIAAPCVVTWTNHGLQAGSTVVFSTTGALPTGLTAGTRYYVIAAGLTASAFEISATEGGAAINTSGSQSGVHTAVSNPVLPASYTYFRRIFSTMRAGGVLKPYVQDGDYVRWLAAVLDVNTVNPGVAAITSTLTLPVGVNLKALLNVGLSDTTPTTTLAYLSDLAATDEAPAGGAAPVAQVGTVGTAAEIYWGGEVRTNKAAQLRYRLSASSANTTIRIATLGWTDTRGRDA